MVEAAPENAVKPGEVEELKPVESAAVEGAEQDDFDSGFDDEPTVTPANVETQPAEPEVPAPEYVQITKEDFERLNANATTVVELKAAMDKQFGTAFGKMGGLERTLTQLQTATPAGQSVEFTDDMAAELLEDYPDIGVGTVKALKNFAAKMKGVGAAAPQVDQGKVAELVESRLVSIQTEDLEDSFSDWREIVGTPDDHGVIPNTEYRQWLAKQPEDYQRKLNGTNSAGVIARSITKFKEFKPAPTPPSPQPSARKQLITEAVNPRGQGGSPSGPTANDEFNSGFNSG